MKTRQGFVSNSSTTSFMIYGADTNNEDADELAREIGLTCEYYQEYSEHRYAVGLSWDEVKDDETAAQFKARVEEAVKKILPEVTDADFGTCQDAYRDG